MPALPERPFFRPSASSARVAAGAMGGVVGGLLFGVMMLTHVIAFDLETGRTGMADLIRAFLGTSSTTAVWSVHIATSLVLGVLFALVVAPSSYRTSLIAAEVYALVVLAVSQLVLRTVLGVPLVLDAGALFALVGHLVYGVGLGLTYPGFHRLEMREARNASSPRVRAWGRRERERMRRT